MSKYGWDDTVDEPINEVKPIDKTEPLNTIGRKPQELTLDEILPLPEEVINKEQLVLKEVESQQEQLDKIEASNESLREGLRYIVESGRVSRENRQAFLEIEPSLSLEDASSYTVVPSHEQAEKTESILAEAIVDNNIKTLNLQFQSTDKIIGTLLLNQDEIQQDDSVMLINQKLNRVIEMCNRNRGLKANRLLHLSTKLLSISEQLQTEGQTAYQDLRRVVRTNDLELVNEVESRYNNANKHGKMNPVLSALTYLHQNFRKADHESKLSKLLNEIKDKEQIKKNELLIYLLDSFFTFANNNRHYFFLIRDRRSFETEETKRIHEAGKQIVETINKVMDFRESKEGSNLNSVQHELTKLQMKYHLVVECLPDCYSSKEQIELFHRSQLLALDDNKIDALGDGLGFTYEVIDRVSTDGLDPYGKEDLVIQGINILQIYQLYQDLGVFYKTKLIPSVEELNPLVSDHDYLRTVMDSVLTMINDVVGRINRTFLQAIENYNQMAAYYRAMKLIIDYVLDDIASMNEPNNDSVSEEMILRVQSLSQYCCNVQKEL